MTETESNSAPDTAEFNVSRGQLIYATTLIGAVSGFNYLDRAGLSIVLEPIKAEFGFTDTQLGLLTGFAFSLTYALFAIPLARLADTGNRVRLLSACIAVWSVATALTGTVTNFLQMALMRVVVGVGEAGGNPASVSMLGDYYPPETRTRGLSFFNLGASVGGTLGLALIGVIADQFGWRMAFFAMGLPGILLSILLFTTLREPVRGRFQDPDHSFETDIGWWQAVKEILSRKTVRHLLIAFGIVSFGGNGMGAWFGAFFMRTHDLSMSEVGAVVGLVIGLTGIVGTVLGAIYTPMLVRRDRRWEPWLPGIGYAFVVPTHMLVFYLDDLVMVYAALGLATFVGSLVGGAMLSSLQSVLPAHLRAMGMAMLMFAQSFIGAGAGPLLIGWASDAMAPQFGDESLRYALMIGAAIIGWGAVHFFFAARHFKHDLVS
jgi:MFS family permease